MGINWPENTCSPPTLWTVLPTCLGIHLGSALKRGRPLVLWSGTVFWDSFLYVRVYVVFDSLRELA